MKRVGLIIVLLLTLCLAFTACNRHDNEKVQKTIEIKTIEDLKSIKNYLGDEFSLYVFDLKNDIDLSNENWEPIGYNNENSFRATFKGNGHTISSLSIKGADEESYLQRIPYSFVGLFGYIYDATIQNLNIADMDITFFAESDYIHVGGLAGYAFGDNILSEININGKIAVGTSFYLREKANGVEVSCDQMQYIGGMLGYSSGKLILEKSTTSVDINNLFASRGPKYDFAEADFVYEKDENGEDTTTIVMKIITEYFEPENFPTQVFAGGFIGLAKGAGTVFNNIQSTSQLPVISSKSAYLGGMFGAIYKAQISNAKYTGNLGTKIYVKGVMGGIAGLMDETTINNAEVIDSELGLSVSRLEYQSYTVGGLVGFANDFSTIKNSQIKNTKVISNLRNAEYSDNILNYPVIGGIAGTIRDSIVNDCDVVEGGVYRLKVRNGDGTYAYTNIDSTFIFSIGMVADVYGNSSVTKCTSSFLAYKGAIGKASESVYIEENGRRVLRYSKKGLPKVYVDIDAFVEGEVLKINIINDEGDIIETKTYADFVGTDIEEYSQNYYDSETCKLINADGTDMTINGKVFDNYERLTGKYNFAELDYLESSVIYVGENDIDIKADWKRQA